MRDASASCRTPISLASYGALLVQFSPLGGGGAGARRRCRRSSPRRSSRATRSGCSAGARPRRACRCYLETRARARGPREGGEAVRARRRCSSSATARSSSKLYREDRALTMRRGAWGFVLGLLGTARVLRRVRVDRGRARCAGAITLGEMTMYLLAVPAGPVGAVGELCGDRRHVRGQPLPVEPLRVPRAGRRAAAPATRRAGPEPGDGIRFEHVSLHVSGRDRAGAATTSTLHMRPGAERRAGRRERLRQDDAHQAAHAPLRAEPRPHPARRPRPRASGTPTRCASASA